MIRIRILVCVSSCGLAIAAAPAVSARNASCVGQFAAASAQEDAQVFAADMSGLAREAPGFGRDIVSPFVHLPREVCQTGD